MRLDHEYDDVVAVDDHDDHEDQEYQDDHDVHDGHHRGNLSIKIFFSLRFYVNITYWYVGSKPYLYRQKHYDFTVTIHVSLVFDNFNFKLLT